MRNHNICALLMGTTLIACVTAIPTAHAVDNNTTPSGEVVVGGTVTFVPPCSGPTGCQSILQPRGD